MTRNAAAAAALLALFAGAFRFFPAPAAPAPAPRPPEGDFIRASRPEPLPQGLAEAYGRLETSRIAAHIRFLADPGREGRGLGTRGLEDAAYYVAEQLKAAGIPPLGPSYFQPVPLRAALPAKGRILLHTRSGTFAFDGGQSAVLPRTRPGTISGPLVFAGYGIRETSPARDDFSGLDVRGKIVVFLEGVPPGPEWQRPELLEKYSAGRPEDRYDARLELLEELGAKAAVALEAGLDRRIEEGKEPAEPYFLAPEGVPPPAETPLARATLTPELRALSRKGFEGSAELAVRAEVRNVVSANVVGRLQGAGKAAQAVMLGAHMDHLGKPGGKVHPGADDNASGVAALLEIARAIASGAQRPKRTLIFAFWTGEEEGKFGSGHYARQPLWPLDSTSAYLNLDMIGHPWPQKDIKDLVAGAGLKDPKAFLDKLDPLYFAEPGVSRNRPDMAPVLARAGLGAGMSLHLDWTDGRSGGSDYREFARRGVPFVRFFGSYFPKYHTPEDTPDKLDPAQTRRVAGLALNSAWLLADR